MGTMLVGAVVLGWLVCSVLAYGLTLNYFHNEFKDVLDTRSARRGNIKFALSMSLAGPISLLIAFSDFKSDRTPRRLMFKHPKGDQRLPHFQQMEPF